MSGTIAACPQCIVFSEQPSVEDARETVENHNSSRHGGEEFAVTIDGSNESLRNFMEHAEQVANSAQYEKIVNKMRKGGDGMPFFISSADFDEIVK